MTQQPEELEQALDIIRDQHKALLLQIERPGEVDLEQVRIFLKTLAQGGAVIDEAEDRVLLHNLIRYWSSFISDKIGEFPVVQLQPFDGILLTPRSKSMEDPAIVHTWLHQINASLAQQITEQRNTAQDLRNMLNTSLAQVVAEQKKQGEELQNMLIVKLDEINTTLVTSLSELIVEQKRVGDKLTDVATNLETSTIALGTAVQGLGKATAEQSQVLASMPPLQVEQRRLTSEMAAATVEIKNVLQAVHNATPELRSMAVDIDRFVQALRAIPSAISADLLGPLQHYSAAAAAISQGSHDLQKAAHELEKRLRASAASE